MFAYMHNVNVLSTFVYVPDFFSCLILCRKDAAMFTRWHMFALCFAFSALICSKFDIMLECIIIANSNVLSMSSFLDRESFIVASLREHASSADLWTSAKLKRQPTHLALSNSIVWIYRNNVFVILS